jgi:LacI family transcriptional regulator, galactose operon repressor
MPVEMSRDGKGSPEREPTIHDLAREAGVSKTTASRVLNGALNVAPETRARVLAAVDLLNYRVNTAARSLRTTKTFLVGLLVPAVSNDVFGRIAEVMEETFRRDGVGLLIASSGWDAAGERIALESLLARRVDALVLSLVDDRSESTAALLASIDRPIVLLDREVAKIRADSVLTDQRSAFHEAVEHLAGLGHERIGVATISTSVRPGREGRAGFEAAMAVFGLESAGELIVPYNEINRASGRQVADRLLEAGATAIVAGTPLAVTAGILQRLNELELEIPHDVSLVSIDDSDFASLFQPPLTVITRSLDDVAHCAARVVAARLAEPDLPPQVEIVPMRLVVRRSTCPPSVRAE